MGLNRDVAHRKVGQVSRVGRKQGYLSHELAHQPAGWLAAAVAGWVGGPTVRLKTALASQPYDTFTVQVGVVGEGPTMWLDRLVGLLMTQCGGPTTTMLVGLYYVGWFIINKEAFLGWRRGQPGNFPMHVMG